MNKAIQLQLAYMKYKKPHMFDLWTFFNEISPLGFEIEAVGHAPSIDLMMEFDKNPTEKEEFKEVFNEYYKRYQWNIIEVVVVNNEDRPSIYKKRLVAEMTFEYSLYYNMIDNVNFKLVDSHVWDVLVYGGDGDDLKFKEVDGYYITSDGIYTEIDFGYYMDFETTDGALMISAKFQNNLLIDSILHATYEKDIKRIETLYREGKDINETNNFGQTPLMIAVDRLYVECVQKLLELNADVDVKDNCGMTVFDYLREIKKRKYFSDRKQQKVEQITKLFNLEGGLST